eukprot:TRINITY_DN45631_c0_g1_i1.p2 TRINITY_DN45631_c0_g1~~TRINITY_DN45631_c0_g1_i1.p2  ORF type:complete len:153 (+),score=47.17 TRINITY_DN45631_c0_g1_i1:51-509(+)
MPKAALSLALPQSQLAWLAEQATANNLPDSGKALRCCVNFVAQTGPAGFTSDVDVVADDAKPLSQQADAAASTAATAGEDKETVFELSSEQSAWLEDIARTKFGGSVSSAASAVLRHCAQNASSQEVFGVIRCKSKTPEACEGFKAATEAAS